MLNSTEELKSFILQQLEDKKAENITVIDLESKTPIAKYMIFATGRSTKNISAIAEHISTEIKRNSTISTAIEGLGNSAWVVLDTGSIIIHLFHPEARDHYRLEEMWNK